MVRRIAILFVLLWATSAHASILERCSCVPSANCFSATNGTETDITLCSGIQAGDRIVVSFEAGGSQTPNTPTDSVGNAFTLITGGNQTNGAGQALYHFNKVAVAGDAGATLKCTVGASAFIECNVRVFYSTDGTTPQVGATNFSTSGASTTYTFANTNVPTKSGSFILFSAYDNGGIPNGGSNGWSVGPFDTIAGNSNGTATGLIGDSSTASWTSPTLTGASGVWMGAALEIQTSNTSSAGAVVVSVGALNSGTGNCSAQTPGPQTQNGDIEFMVMAINSATPAITPPAGWTLGSQIALANANPNLTSLTDYTHVKAGGDGASWNFTNASTNGNICVIVSVGNLNTTTPVDVATKLASGNAGNGTPLPLLNPTANEEVIFRIASIAKAGTFTGNPAGVTQLTTFNQGQVDFEVAVNDPTLGGPLYATNNSGGQGAVGISLGLQSAATPTRPTANQRVDQLGLITLTPFGAPEPPPSCGNCGLGVGAP